jgi:hypothetical protein
MKDNVVKTTYGCEIAWAVSKTYSGKILVFENVNSVLPFHFHKQRNKSWFINSGKFKIQWIDTADGKRYAQELTEGGVFHVPALMPVMIESQAPGGAIAEVGDAELENDFFRLT